MKNEYSILGLLFLLFSSCSSFNLEHKSSDEYLIKSTLVSRYLAIEDKGIIIKNGFDERNENAVKIYTKYDQKGKVLENKFINSEGITTFRSIKKYNTKGNVIESINFKKGRPDTTIIIHTFENNRIERIISRNKGKERNQFFKYDSNGNEIERLTLEPDEGYKIKCYRSIYTYDSLSNLIKDQTVLCNGNIYDQEIYKYDSFGNEIENLSYFNELESKTYSKYDEKNRKIEYSDYGIDGELYFKEEFYYDEHDRIVERIKHRISQNRIERLRFIREYDKNKQVIKLIILVNDEPKYLVETTLEYF